MQTQGTILEEPVVSQAATRNIVVIGASAGGLSALRRLLHALPEGLPAALFVVVHMNPEFKSEMAQILDAQSAIPVLTPADRTPIQMGRIYMCSPDRHLLIEDGLVRVVRGPRENRHRPAIDPLFRSAAWAYGPRVVGIVLTGYLDDGAAGLWAIKSCGGTTVVQDPADAQHPEMPENALRYSDVDYCLPMSQMGPLVVRLASEPVHEVNVPKPRNIKTEVEIASMEHDRTIDEMGSLGRLSPFTCPTCRGALWELQDADIMRYRCHTGHAFSADSLILEQTNDIENSIYAALRAVEEKAAALRRLSGRWHGRHPRIEADYIAKAEEMERSAEALRALLSGVPVS